MELLIAIIVMLILFPAFTLFTLFAVYVGLQTSITLGWVIWWGCIMGLVINWALEKANKGDEL